MPVAQCLRRSGFDANIDHSLDDDAEPHGSAEILLRFFDGFCLSFRNFTVHIGLPTLVVLVKHDSGNLPEVGELRE